MKQQNQEDKWIRRIAKQSTKKAGTPKRPFLKFTRQWIDDRIWYVKMTVLWWCVKLKLFNFYRWEAMCFNRKDKFE